MLEEVGPAWIAGGVADVGRDLPKLELDGFMIVELDGSETPSSPDGSEMLTE